MLKLSPSSLSKYWRCPELFRKIYIDKEIERPRGNWKMIAGVGAHAALEFALKAKMNGERIDPAAMMIVGQRELGSEWRKGVSLPLEAEIGGDNVYRAMAQKKMERCIQTCYKKLVPKVDVIAAEKWVEYEWRPGVQIRGKIDFIERVSGNNVEIGDLKVGGSRTPDKHSAISSAQLFIYAILVDRLTNLNPVSGKLWHFVDSKRPHFTPRTVNFSKRNLRAMEKKIDRTIDAIQAESFPPGDPFWVCNPYRCEYHNDCPMGAGVEDE